jgi:hypothetical protein
LDVRGRKLREAGEKYLTRSFITCDFRHIILGYQIEEDEMGVRDMRNIDKVLVRKFEMMKSL